MTDQLQAARIVPTGHERSLWLLFEAVVLRSPTSIGADAWGAFLGSLVDGTDPNGVVTLAIDAQRTTLDELDRPALTHLVKDVQAAIAARRAEWNR